MSPTTAGGGRSGPLLATGTLETYTPLGAFGQPVYLAHVQLKAAVRQKLGPRYADFFATPDREPGSGRIRWLADVQGPRVRWNDLPPDQQVLHALSIEELRSGFARYADDLRALRTSQQAQAFVALLDTALRVPDDSHLFLVGEQPVVSFWGFSHGDGAVFDALSVAPRPPEPAGVPPPAPAPAVADAPRRGWLWWLAAPLLLLLPALLAAHFLGLFDRFRLPDLGGRLPAIVDAPPTAAPPADKPASPAPIPDPAAPAPGLPPGPDPVEPGRTEPVRPVVPGGVIVPDGGLAVVPDGGLAVVPDGGLAVVPTGPGAGVPPGAVLRPVDPAPGLGPAPGTGGIPDRPGAYDGIGKDLPPVPDKRPPDKAIPDKPTPDKAIPDKAAPDGKPSPIPQHKPALPPLPPPGQAAKPGAELAIPPASGAAATGDPAFMEGLWRSRRGLVDTGTGQPLEQYYRFDRSGQGEVVLRRQDGTECSAPARASMQNGVLSIDELANARCPDGATVDRARTECRRLPDGRTVCSGTGSAGSTYSIGIEKGN